MKPLKLTMQAFANYAGKQEIDFTQLNGRNMFLITGKTGAGKTTIFDAISYVLFNKTSGDFRKIDTLRSDYADGSVETYVELEFEIKGETYKVKRQPLQIINKKRGEGTTEKSAMAELILPKDEKPITGVDKVTSSVEDLLGVTAEQFRQIVMLPQGEFIRFLKASSTDKEDIFRKIFGTEIFKKIQEKLDIDSSILKKELDGKTKEREIHIKKIKSDEHTILASYLGAEELNVPAIVDFTKELINTDLKIAEDLKIKNEEVSKKVKELESKNNNFNNDKAKVLSFEESKLKFEEKSKLEPTVLDYKATLELAKKAVVIKQIDSQIQETNINIEKSNITYQKASQDAVKINNNIKISKNNFDNAKARKNEEKELDREQNELERNEKFVTEYVTKKKELTSLKERNELLSKENKGLENLIKNEESKRDEIEKQLTGVLGLGEKLVEIRGQGTEKADKLKKLQELKSGYKDINDIKMIYNKQSQDYKVIEIEFNNAKNNYEVAEDNFKKAQAGILAEGLVDGEMCPVCGSKEHPVKAVKADNILSEQEIKNLKIIFEAVSTKKEKALNKLIELNSKVNSEKELKINVKARELADILADDFIALDESTQLSKVDNVIDIISKEKDILSDKYRQVASQMKIAKQNEEAKGKLVASIKDNKEKLERISKDFNEMNTKYIACNQDVQNLEKELNEDMRDLDKIRERKVVVESTIKEIEKAMIDSEKIYSDLVNKQVSNNKTLEITKETLDELNKKINTLKANFDAELKNQNLTIDEYHKALGIKDISELENRITKYYKDLNILEGALNKATDDYKVLDIKDVENIDNLVTKNNEEIKLSTEEFKETQTKINNLENRASHNSELVEEILKISDSIKDKEKEYESVKDLSQVAGGKGKNIKKMTFESYILTAYFDDIIGVANQRLDKMTNGRFELRRSKDVKGNARRGLDLSVLDNNTGSERGINSLSGGESFKAALALALGLADVVQNFAGGISIETMFIDEGFGTLDPESLDSAVNCLLDIQSNGRLVGVISHVQELKERIEARLEITQKSDNRGSKAEFVFK